MTSRFRKKFPFQGACFALLILLLAGLILSCNQDSIFADISVEPEYKEPRIRGTPANIVAANGPDDTTGKTVYAASTGSKTVHRYRDGVWSTFSAPGPVMALASDNAASPTPSPTLYALIGDDLKKYEDDNNSGNWDWITIDKRDALGYSLQTIYGANGTIFAGGSNGSSWAVFYTSSNGLVKLGDTAAMLTGAAVKGTDYYLSTGKGTKSGIGGIYKAESSSPQPQPQPQPLTLTLNQAPVTGSEYIVTGIMNLGDEIIAVTSDGKILVYDGSKFSIKVSDEPAFTGGMSVWGGNWDDTTLAWQKPKLLLLGIHATGSTNKGYREVELDGNGKLNNPVTVFTPGSSSPSSVSTSNASAYEASIARYSVYSILQVPGAGSESPVIFAATANNGLQSLRDGLWNAED